MPEPGNSFKTEISILKLFACFVMRQKLQHYNHMVVRTIKGKCKSSEVQLGAKSKHRADIAR